MHPPRRQSWLGSMPAVHAPLRGTTDSGAAMALLCAAAKARRHGTGLCNSHSGPWQRVAAQLPVVTWDPSQQCVGTQSLTGTHQSSLCHLHHYGSMHHWVHLCSNGPKQGLLEWGPQPRMPLGHRHAVDCIHELQGCVCGCTRACAQAAQHQVCQLQSLRQASPQPTRPSPVNALAHSRC